MEFLAQEQTLSRCSQNIDAMPVHDGVRKALSRFSTICAAELMRRLCGLDQATGCEGTCGTLAELDVGLRRLSAIQRGPHRAVRASCTGSLQMPLLWAVKV
jgi:hypothetical protein